jgi:hypothetical protein
MGRSSDDPRLPALGASSWDSATFRKNRIAQGCGVTPLLLAGPLQRSVNRGQGVRGMDDRDANRAEVTGPGGA